MISVTESAAQQIHLAAADSGADGMALRVAAHYDEDNAEIQFGIGFDVPHEDDNKFEISGVNILISPLSSQAVAGLTIDYVEIGPGDFRFIFIRDDDQPSAAGGCGSGSCSSSGCGSGRCN